MYSEVLYIKLNQDVEVTGADIFLKDLGSLFCNDETIVNRCNSLKVCTLKPEQSRKVISVMKIIQMITEVCPGIRIENIGETDIIIERVKQEKKGKYRKLPKIVFVCLISFFGTAFTIMAFHNDIQIQELFNKVHVMIAGSESNGNSLLEVSYSVGLCIGIIVFFNHIGGKRISADPTPIEVEMRIYEEDVNKTLIENAERMNIEADTKG